MAIKPPGYYETIFRELGIEIIAGWFYPAYPADQYNMIQKEKVWVLREDPCSAKNNGNQLPLFHYVKKPDGNYSVKFTHLVSKTVQKKFKSMAIGKAPHKKDTITEKRKEKIHRDMKKQEGKRKLTYEEAEVTTTTQKQFAAFFDSKNSNPSEIKSPNSIRSDVNDSENDQDTGLNKDFKNKLNFDP